MTYILTEKILIGKNDYLFSHIQFSNMSYVALGKIVSTHWDFGDGKTSDEQNPAHIYTEPGGYKVTLTAKDDLGFQESYTEEIELGDGGAEKMSILFDQQEDHKLIRDSDESIELRLAFKLLYDDDVDFQLLRSISTNDKIVEENLEPLNLVPGEEKIKNVIVPNKPGKFRIKHSLLLRGLEIYTKEVDVVLDTEPFPTIVSYDTGLIDEDKNHIIIKITESWQSNVKKINDFLKDQKSTLNMALIDNSLCPGGEGYDETKMFYYILKDLFKEKFPQLDVKITRIATERDRLGFFPVKRIVEVSQKIQEIQPDIILISVDLQDLFNFTPIETLTDHFNVMINQLLARTKARIVLVTPPPLISHPDRSKVFAIALGKLGLKRRLSVADVYEAVNLYEGDWKTLYLDDEKPDNVYNLYLNTKGQYIIAKTIFKTLIED